MNLVMNSLRAKSDWQIDGLLLLQLVSQGIVKSA